MFNYLYQFIFLLRNLALEVGNGKQLLLATYDMPCATYCLIQAEFILSHQAVKPNDFFAITPSVPFGVLTNSSGTSSLNSNIQVHGLYQHGLNNKYDNNPRRKNSVYQAVNNTATETVYCITFWGDWTKVLCPSAEGEGSLTAVTIGLTVFMLKGIEKQNMLH